MKRILLTIAVLVLSLAASAQTIRINADGEKLQAVLKMISGQSDYKFAFNSRNIDTSVPVTVSVESDRIEDVMAAVLSGTGIGYSIMGKQIALFATAKDTTEESRPANESGAFRVHGIVTDEEGFPLEGAGIMVKGSTTGTASNSEGKWSLEVPGANSVLLVSYIGMEDLEIPVNGRSNIVLGMKMSRVFLDQVVVTGYQTLSRERSAGSFANVSGAAVKDQANIHGNILRSLEGSAAGLNVTETADGVTYLIRGVSSINSKREPLFIVDGVAMTREQMDKMVNPNDVESVNFLKDATAASIWGAQAANGVIVITTKKGKSGDLRIAYNGSFTFKGKPDWSYMDLMTSEQFIKTAVEVFDPQTYKWSDVQNNTYGIGNDYRVIYPHEYPLYRYFLGEISMDERDAILSELSSVNGRKEYEKYFMSNAYLMNHSLSFSGGSEKSSFYVSMEYQRTQGVNKDTEDEYRLFFRDALQLTKWMELDLSAHLFYSNDKSYRLSYDLTNLPYMSYFDKDGKELSLTNYVMSDAYRSSIENITGIGLNYYPVSDFLSNPVSLKTLGANANAGLTVHFTDWLNYEGRFQYSLTKGTGESYLNANSFWVRLERTQGTDKNGTQYLPSSGGHYTFSASDMSSYTVRNQLNLDKSMGNNGMHRLTGVAGFEISSRKTGGNSMFLRGYDMQTMEHIFYDEYTLSRTGVKNPALPSFAASSTNTFDPNEYNQNEMEYRFVSMYANGAYTLLDKYSFNASIRVDQSNLFGSDPSVQFKPIWSTGFIWNAAKEDFMRSTSAWLNRLNLRASFGYAGNSPDPGQGGPYNILSSVSNANFSRFGLGYVVITPANDKLSWEKTRIINFGIDWAVLNNRLGGSIDVYDKYTTNLLGNAPVDPTTGFTTVLSNIGALSNRGVELSLNSTNISAGEFEWTTDFNITYNRNKLEEMYVEPPRSAYAMIQYDYWEGYPYGTVFAYKWAGLDPADGMPRVYDSAGNIVRSVTDVDTIDAVPYAGTTVPPVFGSLNNDFRWGNWDLSFSFIYNLGHVMRNDVNTTSSYRLGRNLHNDFAKRWKQPGDEQFTNVPAYYSLKNTAINETDVLFLYKYSDINVITASYIKLREVSLGYRLPASACKALHVQHASARLQASNLATIAFNKEGIDPEAFYFSGTRADRFHPFISASLDLEF
jgi:TonB-linked SusC/RagA family outer membrane protein